MTNIVRYAGNQGTNVPNTDRNPSPFLWQDCPWRELEDGTAEGICEFHEFHSGGKLTSPTTEAALVGLPLSGFGSSSGQTTVTYDNAAGGGALVLTLPAADDHAMTIRSAQTPYQISTTSGSFWFETRLKMSSVATHVVGLFAGLAESTAATTSFPLTASSGAIPSGNMVGFHKPVANTTTLNASFRADDTDSTVDAASVVLTGIGTLAANTYVKLGMHYNSSTRYLNFYLDGVRQAPTATDTSNNTAALGATAVTPAGLLIPNALGTTFPADTAMGWIIEVVTSTAAAASTTTVDWVRVAQLGFGEYAGA